MKRGLLWFLPLHANITRRFYQATPSISVWEASLNSGNNISVVL